MSSVKEEAARLVASLSDDATWEDLMYEIYVRQEIESGIADADAGRVFSTDEIRRGLNMRAEAPARR